MNIGLTITCISTNKKKSTFQSFKKFGNKYWDDTTTNKSKIGYYFAYYFQKKYVYIYKIINILPPSKRPADMDWDSDKNILCFGPRLKEFTWDEWINGVGFGAPYTPDYRINQTFSSSYDNLCISHGQFNFNTLINILSTVANDIQSVIIEKPVTLVIEDKKDTLIEEDYEDEDEEEVIKRERDQKILEANKEAEIRLKNAKKQKILKARIDRLKDENAEIDKKISELNALKTINTKKISDIMEGKYDEEIVL